MSGAEFRNLLASEWIKMRTLPAMLLACSGTIVFFALLTGLLSATDEVAAGRSPLIPVILAVPFAQAGAVLIGVLPVAHEYSGRQITVTLIASPSRWLLVLAKTVVVLLLLLGTMALALGLSLALASASLDAPGEVVWTMEDTRQAAGVGAYMVLIGMLAHATALLARRLIPALAVTLSLVMVVSPLLATVTEHARLLPDRAARMLFTGGDGGVTEVAGALLACAWIVVLGVVGAYRFQVRDAEK